MPPSARAAKSRFSSSTWPRRAISIRAVGDLDENVFLYDIEALEATCEKNRRQRAKEIDRARRIIQEETGRFVQDIYHKATGPLISQLREKSRQVREEEERQLFAKLPTSSPRISRPIQRSIERDRQQALASAAGGPSRRSPQRHAARPHGGA